MKARIRTSETIQKELTHDEINRIFKLCCLCLNEQFGFGEKRMKKFCERVSQISGTVHENPEQWYYIDEYLLGKYRMGNLFKYEDLNEREIATKQIHKENGIKWRQY